MTGSTLSLALLGQPNSGKSTLFNRLTGSHQHVGNWPGKTVEQKTGSFTRNGTRYEVCDLPGSYSLSAQSQEERVTQDYIESGGVDVIVVMADASQLSRSLYMLADVAGIEVPCVRGPQSGKEHRCAPAGEPAGGPRRATGRKWQGGVRPTDGCDRQRRPKAVAARRVVHGRPVPPALARVGALIRG